jgi:hypothetical protein
MTKEIEYIGTPKAQVPARRAEVRELTTAGPVMDGLDVHAATTSNVRRRQQVP